MRTVGGIRTETGGSRQVAAVKDIKVPETKTQVQQILEFFSWFRDYIPDFALHAKALTDLTGKRIPAKVPWGKAQQEAFNKVKELLCKATMDLLQIVDLTKPFNIYDDASDYAVGVMVSQSDDNGNKKPIAFPSKKLNMTQRGWSTIKKSRTQQCGRCRNIATNYLERRS